jgi:M6 family metalloprotease-like protein
MIPLLAIPIHTANGEQKRELENQDLPLSQPIGDDLSQNVENTSEIRREFMKDDLMVEQVGNSMMNGPRPSSIMTRPTTGVVNVLAMCVQFTDQSYSVAYTSIDNRWDGATGSVKHYFLENSFGKLTINVTTLPWVTAPKSISYYCTGDSVFTLENELMNWAFSYWDSAVNFNNYNYMYIVYSGTDAKNDTHFWPHVWTTSTEFYAGDGVSYDKFGFVGENSKMGTFAHEFGHSLGLLDYYNYEESGDVYCGYWELMDCGNYNDEGNHPAGLSAYSKITLGWISSNEILIMNSLDQNIGEVNLFHLEAYPCPTNYYYAVKISYSSTYYYLIEFRDNEGYDAYLPDKGVLWSKIDLTKNSGDGRLIYVGGDHEKYDLDGVEFDDDDTANSDSFINWLTGSFELSISAIMEYSSYMTIFVDCFHDFGTNWEIYNNLAAGSSLVWTLNNLEVGQFINIFWDTPAEGSGSDFEIKKDNGGSWTTILSKPNIWQDALNYRITAADNYKVSIYNDNVMTSMNIYHKLFTTTAPNHSLSSNNISTTFYINQNVTNMTFSVKATNLNSGWDENTQVTLGISGNISFQVGEVATKTWINPFKNKETTFTWNIKTNGTGSAQLTVNSVGSFDSATLSRTIQIVQDITPPSLNLNGNSLIYTNQYSYYFTWSGQDSQSGIDSYILKQNNTSITNTKNLYYSYSFGQDGIYNFLITASDKVGNTNNASKTIIFDATSPNSPTILSNTTNLRGSYNLMLSVSDNLSGIESVQVYYYNTKLGNATILGNKANFTMDLNQYINSGYGNVIMTVDIYDRAGNKYSVDVNLELATSTSSSTNNHIDNIPYDLRLFVGIGGGVILIGVATSIIIRKRRVGNLMQSVKDLSAYSHNLNDDLSQHYSSYQNYSTTDFSDGKPLSENNVVDGIIKIDDEDNGWN